MACLSHLLNQLLPFLRQAVLKKFPVILNKNRCYYYHGPHVFSTEQVLDTVINHYCIQQYLLSICCSLDLEIDLR